MSYKIQRFYFKRPGSKRTLHTVMTLEQAQKHCQDPEASSSTCRKPHNVRRTKQIGDWFDSYTEVIERETLSISIKKLREIYSDSIILSELARQMSC